jgi:hypothetical protein
MTFLPILLLLALAAGSARANIEYVDMGPVSGTVQGHVWSKVVDEVGNTKGRAETWQVNLDGPADVVFTFRAPDLYQVNARISWWIDGEGEFTWDMGSTPKEQIPGGYQISFSFDPKFKKRIAVTVSPKRTVADQIYQLTVASARTGQTPATGAAGDSPETAVVGTWVYRRNDQIRETLVIARSGEGFTVTVLDADGAQISRTDGRFENGWLVTQDARNGGRARVSPDGSLEFVSTRLDTGAVVWTGRYTRKGGASPSPAGAAKNLALGRPARQSSVYTGTGIDQGPQHGVDGITGGRDPYGLILTNQEANPWWRVDLGGVAAIERVRLFNRTNPEVLSSRAIEILVSEDGSNWRTVHVHDGSPWKVLDIPVAASGRHVMVRLGNRDWLALFEVEVWGRMGQ